jgi:hypothetical protein
MHIGHLNAGLFMAGLLAVAGSAQAQQVPFDAPVLAAPQSGHSAWYYGMDDEGEREASIRSVLSSVQLDRPHLEPSLAAEVSYFVVRMLLGGRGAPADIADPFPDLTLNP